MARTFSAFQQLKPELPLISAEWSGRADDRHPRSTQPSTLLPSGSIPQAALPPPLLRLLTRKPPEELERAQQQLLEEKRAGGRSLRGFCTVRCSQGGEEFQLGKGELL